MALTLKALARRVRWINDWKAGFAIGFAGQSFALNPYPTLKISYGFDNERKKRALWSKGYWAGVKASR